MAFIGGHPYRLRLAFYWLKQGMPLEKLLQDAPTEAGIYRSCLQRCWAILNRSPELCAALKQVIADPSSVQLEASIAHRLESIGLVKLDGNRAVIGCELYRQYFSSQLMIDS